MERRPTNIQTDDLERCTQALDQACEWLRKAKPGEAAYAVGRAACIKESEVSLELSGKLLKRRLWPFFASDRQADRLSFKDVFRHAAKHGLISAGACERWLEYRDARNGLQQRRQRPEPRRQRLRREIERAYVVLAKGG